MTIRILSLVLTMSTLSPAWAMEARSTADIQPQGSYSVGLFNPLTLSVNDHVELETHPLFFFAAPHLQLKASHLTSAEGPWRLSSIWSLSFPHPALNASPPLGLQGYFLPTCKVAQAEPSREQWCDEPGWIVVPKWGLVASKGKQNVLTLQMDFAAGLLIAGERPAPLDTYPMLDLLLAPIFNRWRAHLSTRYDFEVFSWLRVSSEGHIYRVGERSNSPRDPWTFALHSGVDIELGSATRLALGLYYWNSDQKRIEIVKGSDGFVRTEPIRSHDLVPTFDIIWNGSL